MTPRQHAIGLLKFVRKTSGDTIKGFPDGKATFQPSPTDNHLLWVLGHLALTDTWIAGVLGIRGVGVPESYNKVFGQGTKPVGASRDYPLLAEVHRVFDSTRQSLMAWYEKAPEAALAIPLSEKTGGFCEDPIDAASKLAWHEGWHMGQVANIRKALGLGPVF